MAIVKPKIGTTCPALIKENYQQDLSGDCLRNCKCAVTDNRCLGVIVEEHGSSQFFSRGYNRIDTEKIKKCPMYGCSKETLIQAVKERMESKLTDKISEMPDIKLK